MRNFFNQSHIFYGLIFAVLLLSNGNVRAEYRIHFWMKAFIPNHHPGLPDYIKKTENGNWVIAAPSIPGSEIIGLGKLEGTCFVTDNRGFDKSPTASARVTIELIFVVNRKTRQVSIERAEGRDKIRIGSSHNVDCKTGKELQPPRTADISNDVKTQDAVKIIGITASVPNPYYEIGGSMARFAPPLKSIKFDVIFEYDLFGGKVELKGDAGSFPSFEAYYKLNDGGVTSIIEWVPYKDSTAAALADLGLGINMRNFSTKISLR